MEEVDNGMMDNECEREEVVNNMMDNECKNNECERRK